MGFDHFEQTRPAPRSGEHKPEHFAVLAEAAHGADDKHQHEVKIEEMNQVQAIHGGSVPQALAA
jgi:hypothetical protein